LSVDSLGRVSMEERGRVTFPQLHTELTNRLARNAKLPVFIGGSEQASHGSMVYVLDFVRRAGVDRVAFAVETPAEVEP
jgi:biopolymer transport protein ExbD